MKIRLVVTALGLGAGVLLAQDGRPGGRMGMRPNPVFQALDTDADGVLSAAEIRNAAASLKKLDKDGDGQLAMEEMRPNFGGPEGGAAAGGGGASALVTTLMGFDKNGDGKLTKDEVPERMQGMFTRGDLDHDGVLSKDEIQKLAQSQSQAQAQGGGGEREGRGRGGPGGGPGMRMDPLMAALDTDGDGVISASEIKNAPTALLKLDRNGDGQITADEVRPNFGPGGPGGRGGNPEEMISRMFSQFDTNGDGKISKAEAPERLQAQFDQIDEDKDGFVSKAELTKFIQSQGMRPRQ